MSTDSETPPVPAEMYDETYEQGTQDTSRRRPAWTRVVAWVLAGAVGFSVLGILGVQLSNNTPTDPDSTAAAVGDMSAVAWQGAALPVSQAAGPAEFTDTRSSGFTQTELGAALAAVHISSHISPYTGPDVFTPTITQQVTGDTTALLTMMETEYAKAAETSGLTDGEPQLRATGQMLAYRIETFNPDQVTNVELYVQPPAGGEDVIYTVPVTWVDGDWSINPTADDAGVTFAITEPNPDHDYISFQPNNN